MGSGQCVPGTRLGAEDGIHCRHACLVFRMPSSALLWWCHDRSPGHEPVIAVVVVALGHLTHRKHIVHESHVPSQQT